MSTRLTFRTDTSVTFPEELIPPERIEEAIEIAHLLGCDETTDYGTLTVKYENHDVNYATLKAEAILLRMGIKP